MNCTEFERRLRILIETRGTLDAADFQKHVRKCSACRSLWEENAMLEPAIRRWAASLPHVNLTEAIIDKLASTGTAAVVRDEALLFPGGNPFNPDPTEAEHQRYRRRNLGRFAWISTAALALLAAVAIGVSRLELGKRNTAVTQSGERPAVEPAPNRPELASLLRDAGSAYWALAEGAAHRVKGAASIVTPTDEPMLSLDEDPWVPEISSEWFGEWKAGLRPIGDNVAEAFHFLLDAVPAVPIAQPRT